MSSGGFFLPSFSSWQKDHEIAGQYASFRLRMRLSLTSACCSIWLTRHFEIPSLSPTCFCVSRCLSLGFSPYRSWITSFSRPSIRLNAREKSFRNATFSYCTAGSSSVRTGIACATPGKQRVSCSTVGRTDLPHGNFPFFILIPPKNYLLRSIHTSLIVNII